MNEEYKKQVYKKWLDKPLYNIDKSKEPTYAERQIILEMKKREANVKSKYDIELEKRTAEIKRKYTGKIPDSIFDRVSKELGDY